MIISTYWILNTSPSTGPKCFVPVQTFWARPKIELNLFVLNNWISRMEFIFSSNRKCLALAICESILALAQKNWTRPKSFGTCRRTRHYKYLGSITYKSCKLFKRSHKTKGRILLHIGVKSFLIEYSYTLAKHFQEIFVVTFSTFVAWNLHTS